MTKKILATIMFIDIKSSSELWNKYGDKMFFHILNLNKTINKIVLKYDGFIVKTIGDAFMIVFKKKDNVFSSVKCAIEIHDKVIRENKFRLRIGMGYGYMREYKYKIQNNNVLDYFGETVNMASRMESRISPVSGFAIGMYVSSHIQLDIILKICKDLDFDKYEIKITKFENCSSELLRSERLLTQTNVKMKCEDKNILHGVQLSRAYVFTPI